MVLLLPTLKKKKMLDEQEEKNSGQIQKEESPLSNHLVVDDVKKKVCANCGKKLTLFQEYLHPTLGKNAVLCSDCYEKAWRSMVQWERFIAWSSFNPETPDPSYINNFPYIPKDKTIRKKKSFKGNVLLLS